VLASSLFFFFFFFFTQTGHIPAHSAHSFFTYLSLTFFSFLEEVGGQKKNKRKDGDLKLLCSIMTFSLNLVLILFSFPFPFLCFICFFLFLFSCSFSNVRV